MTTLSAAMPEANVLYSVTGVVVAGLVAWVAIVLSKAKEPWSRPAPPELPAEDEVPAAVAATDDAKKLDADDTSRATPLALSEGRTKAAEDASEEAKDEEKKSEEA